MVRSLDEWEVGTEVSLEQVLRAREERAGRQAAALARFDRPAVSATAVVPGPVKDAPLPRRVLAEAIRELEALCAARYWRVLSREVIWPSTGGEAILVIDAEAASLKTATVQLEAQHPLGRLWDLDVIAPRVGPLSRRQFGSPARRCLVCERPAKACGRSRRHSLAELREAIGAIVRAYDERPAG
jgi:holo-ACP synthase